MNAEFVKAGAQILIILGDTLDRARKYAEILKVPFPILADPMREVYHRFELQKNFIGIRYRGSKWRNSVSQTLCEPDDVAAGKQGIDSSHSVLTP